MDRQIPIMQARVEVDGEYIGGERAI